MNATGDLLSSRESLSARRSNFRPDPGAGRILAMARRPVRRLSRRTRPFQESVIREMTRLGAEVGGVNLAQGLPDFEPAPAIVEALERALASPENHQYSYTW